MGNNVTLDDLKFIENVKNRKAFLIALREVEEEGFYLFDAEESIKKINELEKQQPEKVNNPLQELANISVGSTPAQRAGDFAIRKRKFTLTNAVDLKDYKYWRDPNFGKTNEPQKSSSPFSTGSSPKPSRPVFDNFFDDMPKPDKKPSTTNKSLYDELFGEIVKDHEPKNRTQKTETYKAVEKFASDYDENEDRLLSSEKQTKTQEEKPHQNKYSTLEYRANAKKRAEQFLAMQAEKKKKEAEAKRAEERKKLAIIDEDETAEDIEVQETDVKPVKKTRAKAPAKLMVEVVASDEEKPKKKATTKKKTTTQAKPRKRKKKLDADIKLYRNIHID